MKFTVIRISVGAALLAGMLCPVVTIASGLKPAARMALIRGLTAEYAHSKVVLPRGKKGLLLHADGKIDQENLKHELTQFGTASPPNALVQITALNIQDKQIVFEINGGGQKSKWYQHIQVGGGMGPVGSVDPDTGGPMTYPIPGGQQNPQSSAGSYISLIFPKNIENLTVADVKNYLAPVLDFNPTNPIQAITRPIPPKFQQAIQAKKAEVGMDRDMVLAALGPPQRKVRETKDGVEQEDWIYGTPPMKVTFVTFEGDEVVNVQDFEGGIGGAVQSSSEPPPR